MTRVKDAPRESLRSILCFAFKPNALQEDRQALEHYLIGRGEVVHALESEGSFDFMIEATFGHIGHYHDFVADLAARFAPVIRERRASFVCRRFIAGAERSIWVRHGDSRHRLDLTKLDRVTAEGDYVRLHLDGHNFLHHATMSAFEAILDRYLFLRIHRSTILRLATIQALQHKEREWTAQCTDGSTHRIARPYLDTLVERLEQLSATGLHHSSNLDPLDEMPSPPASNSPRLVDAESE